MNMRTSRSVHIAAIVALAMSPFVTSAQDSRTNLTDGLITLLVWGTDTKIDIDAYPPHVRQDLEQYLQRRRDYKSQRRRLTNSSELSMVHEAQVRYERRLVAVTDDPRAASLAAQYVDDLRPCYEWEGYHDCPEREASFATQYRKGHVGGPFGEFLKLLAAHRWLCAAEAYEYEKDPNGVAHSRREYDEALSLALQSTAPLVRAAAEELTARGRCFSKR